MISFFFNWTMIFYTLLVSLLLLANCFFFFYIHEVFMESHLLLAVDILTTMLVIFGMTFGALGVYKKKHAKEDSQRQREAWEKIFRLPKWAKILFFSEYLLLFFIMRPFLNLIFKSGMNANERNETLIGFSQIGRAHV